MCIPCIDKIYLILVWRFVESVICIWVLFSAYDVVALKTASGIRGEISVNITQWCASLNQVVLLFPFGYGKVFHLGMVRFSI